MDKRWIIKPQPDDALALDFASQTGLHPVLAKLLLQRGVSSAHDVDDFFNPSLDNLHDPFLMKDMSKAVERIISALQHNERILIYGDYDVDGTSAVALVFMALGRFISSQDQIDFYIPDRYNEGYGISTKGIQYAHDNGFSLVIALDCGIKAVHRMQLARELGVDFIICDHHMPGEQIPDVVACLNAKQADCPYPDKNLSGCGVGFKLMQALYISKGLDWHLLTEFLDLLVVSIASDIVPIVGENRILAFHGLNRINSHPNVGLASIMCMADIKPGDVSMSDIVFKIGPRINAAGRMRSGNDAVRLLVSTDRAMADSISLQINDQNDERKDLDRIITRQAVQRIENSPSLRLSSSTVLYDQSWSKGVIGIVASRLSETYLRPTIILTRSQANPDFATGSARSVEGFDLYRAIDACSHLLENFGGHTYAAGLTMKIENVEPFQREFESYAAANSSAEQRVPQVDIDLEIDLADVSEHLLAQLDRLEPFGPANARPVFLTRGVYDYSTSKLFGHQRQHIKLDVIDSNGRTVKSGVCFGLGHLFPAISNGAQFDIAYTIERNDYRGRKILQLVVKDIKFSDV